MSSYKIPFNRPVFLEEMMGTIKNCLQSAHMAGDGPFTRKCEAWLAEKIGAPALLCSSATHALEMMALLIDVKPGDEIILPSYTFVSTANSFVLRGAKLCFADVDAYGNIDVSEVKRLISPKTKAVVAVDYAGNAPDYDGLIELCEKHNIILLEDAAQALGSTFKNKPLGSFGQLACFSFHETKNVNCGEGGALIINDKQFLDRAHILREKGTNRRNFYLGKIDKYSWVDIGSSYLCSDLNAAVLDPQFARFNEIQAKRESQWHFYKKNLEGPFSVLGAQVLLEPENVDSNRHIFALIMKNEAQRKSFINYMRDLQIDTPFHYVSLHSAPFAKESEYDLSSSFINTDVFSSQLVRLPLHYNFTEKEQLSVIDAAISWARSQA